MRRKRLLRDPLVERFEDSLSRRPRWPLLDALALPPEIVDGTFGRDPLHDPRVARSRSSRNVRAGCGGGRHPPRVSDLSGERLRTAVRGRDASQGPRPFAGRATALAGAISGSALDALDFVGTVREGDFVAATPERLCGLYVIVDKPRLVSDLQEFLRELGFVAAHPRGEGLDVSIPGSPDTAQARRVVNVYLAIWQAIHPGAHASIAERNPRVSSAA
jgi:hypothetical protein